MKILLFVLGLSLGSLVALSSTQPAAALQPGNIAYEVNYDAVLSGQVRVCDASANMDDAMDDWGVLQWNEAIGQNILSVSCSSPGVTILDTNSGSGACGYSDQPPFNPVPACADYPVSTSAGANLKQFWTPIPNTRVPPYTVNEKRTVVTQELGHNLGFAHQTNDPPTTSVMSAVNPYLFIEPTGVDIANYHTAYTVNPPSNITRSSPAAGQVQLGWDPSQVWNEKFFTIFRRNGAGDYNFIGTAPVNSNGILLTGQPAGTQWYQVGGFTLADCFGFGGFCAASAPFSVNVQAPTGTPDLIVVDVPANYTSDEGLTTPFVISVKNQGTAAAGPFSVRVEFGGSVRPYPQGVCAFNSGLAAGVTQVCTTNAVTWNFGGGTALVRVDYAGQVAESNESNNTKTGGLIAIRPKAPTAVFMAPPYAAYGYTDQSNFESGFGVTAQRRAGSCSLLSPFSISPNLNAPLSGTGTAVVIAPWSPVLHGYCYTVSITAIGPYANASPVTSDPANYP